MGRIHHNTISRNLGQGLSISFVGMAVLSLIVLIYSMGMLPATAFADVTLPSTTVTGSDYEYNSGNINSGSSYTISSGAVVSFEAGGEIDLEPGFTATQGSFFDAFLDTYVETHAISGNTGVNVSGVTITLYGTSLNHQWVYMKTTTGSNGSFSFSGVAQGIYTIAVQSKTYAFHNGTISTLVVGGTDISLNGTETQIVSVSTKIVFYHYDALGNTVAQTDQNGNVIMTAVYSPFGEQFETTGTTEPYVYTGKERDIMGLDYFGARYYDSSIGQFTSMDPVGGDTRSPQSFNRYAYCYNNPYKYVDPTGMLSMNYTDPCGLPSDPNQISDDDLRQISSFPQQTINVNDSSYTETITPVNITGLSSSLISSLNSLIGVSTFSREQLILEDQGMNNGVTVDIGTTLPYGNVGINFGALLSNGGIYYYLAYGIAKGAGISATYLDGVTPTPGTTPASVTFRLGKSVGIQGQGTLNNDLSIDVNSAINIGIGAVWGASYFIGPQTVHGWTFGKGIQ